MYHQNSDNSDNHKPILHTIEAGAILGIRNWETSNCNAVGPNEPDAQPRLASDLWCRTIWPTNSRLEAKCHQYEWTDNQYISNSRRPWCLGKKCEAPCIHATRFGKVRWSTNPCGIYAWNSRGLNTVLSFPALRMWGLAELSGRVVEHSSGYRAEFARPTRLISNIGMGIFDDAVATLTEEYSLDPPISRDTALTLLSNFEQEREHNTNPEDVDPCL